jgi:hypothetical protein
VRHLFDARPHLMNSQILPDIFIAIYLLFAVFWDSPGSNLIERRLKSTLRPFITRMGLSYRWNMYSGPFTDIIELEARARYADGTIAVISLPPRYEFRRYSFMLVRQQRDDLYRAFARYLESWLAKQDRHPVAITLVRGTAKTPVRFGGLGGRFDLESAPKFREFVVVTWVLK